MCWYKKHRIVAEAVVPACCQQDTAFPGALADQRRGVVGVSHEDHQALKACAALCFRDAIEVGQQFFQIYLVSGTFTGKTGRVNTGCTVKGVDFNAGIICDSRQAGVLCRITCLEDGIFDEGQAGLFSISNAEFTLRLRVQIQRGEQLIDLANLPRVTAGKDYLFQCPVTPGPALPAGW